MKKTLQQWKERIKTEKSPYIISRIVDEAAHDMDLTNVEFLKLQQFANKYIQKEVRQS